VIDFKGEVHPCCMSQRAMGSVHESRFEKVWDGPVYRDFRRRLLSAEPPAECRGCAKAGWYHPFELEDWIDVGVNDIFGVQMGSGWGPEAGGVRWSRRRALLCLRNSGKPRLRLELVSSPDAEHPLEQRGEVTVDGISVGRFALTSLAPTSFVFLLPDRSDGDLVVGIECEREHLVAAPNGDLRRLGVGLQSAALVA
jgi:hypothetical protein